jgi:hypothetical protein
LAHEGALARASARTTRCSARFIAARGRSAAPCRPSRGA